MRHEHRGIVDGKLAGHSHECLAKERELGKYKCQPVWILSRNWTIVQNLKHPEVGVTSTYLFILY